MKYDSIHAEGLVALIHGERKDMMRMVNVDLVSLFWEIGNELNKYVDNEKVAINVNFSPRLLTAIQTTYGDFFSYEGIESMRRLHTAFPKVQECYLVPNFISWGQLAHLLTKDDPKKEILELQGKSIGELGLMGIDKLLKNKNFANKKNDVDKREKDSLPQPKVKRNLSDRNKIFVSDLFQPPFLIHYRNLFKRKSRAGIERLCADLDSSEKVFFNNIGQLIGKSGSIQNDILNSNYNLMYWKIGKYLHEIALNDMELKNEIFFEYFANTLNNSFGRLFNKKYLKAAVKLYKIFPDYVSVSSVYALVSWEHLLILLSDDNPYIIVFYAKLTAFLNLKPSQLLRFRSENIHITDHMLKKELDTLYNPVVTKISERRSNYTENGTIVDRSFEITINIFTNRSLMKFISAS